MRKSLFAASFVVLLPHMLSAQQIADSPQTAPRAPSRLIAFDIPLVKDQRTVRLDRIQTINAGSAIAPWSEDLSYDWPVPRFHGAGRDVRADVQGGVFRALESNKTRDIRFVDGTLEGNLSWFVAGMNGFFSREEIPEALSGRHFAATFTRRGYGLRAWGGFKMGEFAGTFVTVKAGRGYVEAKGENRFDASVDGLDPTLLYYERFDSTVAVVDGQVRLLDGRLIPSAAVERNWYRRRVYSPNPTVTGKNSFHDVIADLRLEVVPWPAHDFLRIVLSGRAAFGNDDRLLFRNEMPSFLAALRLASSR